MKFSIIIPCFKTQFLAEAIESVLSQSCADFELVLVNDASPHPVDEVVAKFSDERIKYFRNPKNFGAYNIVENWNVCLSHCEGDYVINMGDDDRLAPNCLETYAGLMEEYPGLNVYHGRTILIDDSSNFIRMLDARPEWETLRSLIWHRLNGRLQYIGDFLLSREWLNSNGGYVNFPLAWNSDDMTVFCAAAGKGIANTNTPVFNYRINSASISMNSYTLQKIECNKKYEGDILRMLQDNAPLDATDALYDRMIKAKLPNSFVKKVVYHLSLDFYNVGYLRTFKTFRTLRKKYPLPLWTIAMAFLEYLKFRKTNSGKGSVV